MRLWLQPAPDKKAMTMATATLRKAMLTMATITKATSTARSSTRTAPASWFLTFPPKRLQRPTSNVAGSYRKYAKIPGFRAGKVPETVVRRRYAGEIRKEVIDSLLPERFNKAVLELGVKPVGQPQVTELTVEDGAPLHVKAVFEYLPDFSIEGYQAVTVDKPSVEITEEEFQQEIEQLRESRATIEPVEEDSPPGGWRLGADYLQRSD